mgnify:CR=1 FL=1
MDENLLSALNNVGESLEALTDAIKEKNQSDSNVSKAIKNGNFEKSLETISAEVKSIKKDTSKILENQETIIELQKQQSSQETNTVEQIGSENQKSKIKEGVGSILLIAGAVLAIGAAFNIIGDVDVETVISVSLGLTILSLAFEKIANIEGLTPEKAFITSGVLVLISGALLASSYLLSNVQNMSPEQGLTTIFIAGAFSVIGYSINKFFKGFEGMGLTDIVKNSAFLIFILPAISLGIMASSYILSGVQTVNGAQLLTSVGIAATFTVMAFGIKQILTSFKDISTADAIKASFAMPLLFTATSAAIYFSSLFLSSVTPISGSQFLTSIGIALTFVVLSYAIEPVVKQVSKMDASGIVKLPVLFAALSGSIALSAIALSYAGEELESLTFSQIGNIAFLGGTLAVISLIMSPAIKSLSKIDPTKLLIGGAAIVGISAVVAASSQLLALGNYDNYPDLGWIAGTGASLVTFGLSAVALGALVFGPQALVFASGLAAITGVAGTIVAVSKILNSGEYNNKGMLDWAKSVSLLYATFTPVILILGTAALASSVLSAFGKNPFKKAQESILDVADTIVLVSHKLQEGDYTDGPTKEWAEGIAIALGGFSPVYKMLMDNNTFSILKTGDIGPEAFTEAISTVTDGIVEASNKLADNKTSFENGPSPEWADGTGKAIGAFAPVYEILASNSSLFSSNISFNDMESGIETITRSIIKSAEIFNSSKVSFDGNYPSVEWSEGVGGAIGAFMPMFDMLKNKSFFESDSGVIDDMKNVILTVTDSLVETAKNFSINSDYFDTSINKDFISNIKGTILEFSELINELSKNDSSSFLNSIGLTDSVISKTTDSLIETAKKFSRDNQFFSTDIDANFIKNIKTNLLGFQQLIKELSENDDSSTLGNITDSLLGNDPISLIAKKMITLSKGYDALATSLTKLGSAMKTLNITDVSMLGNVTRQIIEPEKISVKENDIKQLEEKISNIASLESAAPNNIISNNSINNEELSKKMDQVIALLSNIDNSTSSVDRLIDEFTSDEEGKNYSNLS